MKNTVVTIREAKERGEKVTMLTAYDYSMAKLIDEAGINMILVGDSLTSDMQGANNAGIASCWFNPKARAKDIAVEIDYEIRSLEEVLSIVSE